MRIRQAKPGDIRKLKAIIDSLQVSRQGDTIVNRRLGGFCEYQKSEEDLRKALNPFFVVAETKQGIRGFSLGYDNRFFEKTYQGTQYEEFRFILDNVPPPYLYIDQMGVADPSSLGSGRTAVDLLNWNIEKARMEGLDKIVAYICSKPIANKRSENLAVKRGFEPFGEVEIENGIVLQAYKLTLKQSRKNL
jgi:hypothetical protein